MGSVKVPRMLAAGAMLLMLAAAAAVTATDAPEIAAAPDESGVIREIASNIEAIREQDGPTSSDLIEPLMALGLFYQERANQALAIAAFERARHVTRVNHGLYSLREAPVIQRLVQSEETRGRFEYAWELERQLLTLVRRHPDDARIVPILRDVADKRMDIFHRYVGGEFPPQIVLGCYYSQSRRDDGGNGCRAGSRRIVERGLLREAHDFYSQAVDVTLRNEDYSSDRLPELYLKLLRVSYELANHALGRKSLDELYSYQARNFYPRDALVQMADWDLLFARHRRSNEAALESYERAYEVLSSEAAGQGLVEDMFVPDTPVILPAFLPNPLASGEASDSTGYIDISFEITRHGKSERIEVLRKTGTATRADEADLVRLVRGSKFRPRVSDGEFAASKVVVRYYLSE